MSERHPLRRRAAAVLRMVLTIIAATVLAVPAVSWASHQFTDVPNGAFHDEIAWLANNDITVGCNDAGTRFCPDETVKRRQMAAFLNRLETRDVFLQPGDIEPRMVRTVGDNNTTELSGSDGSKQTANDARITAPVAGFLHITASSYLWNQNPVGADHLEGSDSIDCDIHVDGSRRTNFRGYDVRLLAGTYERCAQTIVVPVAAGAHDVTVVIDNLGSNSSVYDSQLSVLFTPYGANG